MIKKTKDIRDSKFEILRIIAMVLIVAHHFALHGFELDKIQIISGNKIIVDILRLGGKLGVNLFVLISAYFMVDSKFKYKKLIKIVAETWLYSIIILVLFKTILTPVADIGIKQIIKNIFPILFVNYWFITYYIVLMILSPFLNNFINNLDVKLYRKMLITLIVLSVFISGMIQGALGDMSNSLVWFITLYLTIGYIKKHVDLTRNSFKINLIISILVFSALIISVLVLNVLGYKLNNATILNHCSYFKKSNSIFVFVTSIELFIAFIKLPAINNKFINKIASCTLGVYLIHDNTFMRGYLWKTVFDTQGHCNSNNFLIYSIFVIFTVYVVCTIIDFIRQVTVEKIYIKVINNLYDKIERIFMKYKTIFNNKFDINKIL